MLFIQYNIIQNQIKVSFETITQCRSVKKIYTYREREGG